MNKIEENYTNFLGNTKHISDPDENGFICKVFKTRRQMLPIQEQRKIIKIKKQYFGEYIPETILCEFGNQGEYIIKQKYIKGKTLAQTDISTLSAETLDKLIDLIKKYLKFHKEQGGEMDLTGYQFYPGNPNATKRKIMNFLKIKQNFLVSTNIMVSDDGNVYMVDVCESADSRLQGTIKNFCAKPFIKRTIYRLERTLRSKIDTEKTNKELLEALKD